MRKAFPFYVEGGEPRVAEVTDELRQPAGGGVGGFLVSPAVTEVSLQPGGMRMQAVEVRNLTKKPLKLTAHLLGWQRDPDGRDLATDADKAPARTAVP